jgi:hypothetical protein
MQKTSRLYVEHLEDRTLLTGHALATATAINLTKNAADVSGAINSATAVDLFTLNLTAGDTVTAAVNAQKAGSRLDALLRIFNADGKQIASNDNCDGRDPRLTFQAPSTNTYYACDRQYPAGR